MAGNKVKTLKGFRDILPSELLARDKMVATIKKIYESYGFVPLATPSLEQRELVLGAGEEANKQIYLFTDRDETEVGLIYELTASLARVVAENPNLPMPFKRYQIQTVWRYDKPDPGRFREFMQFDIDTVGSLSMLADAEIIATMHDCLRALGIENFRIRFSHRKILNSLIEFAGLKPEMAHPVFRILDKLDKQGLESVLEELGPGRTDQSGDKIKGLGLSDSAINKIKIFLQVSISESIPKVNAKQSILLGPIKHKRDITLSFLRDIFANTPSAAEGLAELEQLSQYLDSFGISDEKAPIDVSIARGLDYYTGPVFEAILTEPGAERFGSVIGGGRYDKSIGRFGGKDVPATGASIGVDRLLSAMIQLGRIKTRPSTADCIVTIMDRTRLNDYIKIVKELRAQDIRAELYVGDTKKIDKQLKYADRQEIPIAIIAGSDEFDKDKISIKDLRQIKEKDIAIADRKEWVEVKVGQVTIARADMIKTIRDMLGR